MKTEMKILDNGNYESIICVIQHACHSNDHNWSCRQYSSRMDRLILQCSFGDPYEDGFEEQTEVIYCPFCGHQASMKKE